MDQALTRPPSTPLEKIAAASARSGVPPYVLKQHVRTVRLGKRGTVYAVSEDVDALVRAGFGVRDVR